MTFLSGMLLSPLLGMLSLVGSSSPKVWKTIGLGSSMVAFLFACLLWISFDPFTSQFQFYFTLAFLPQSRGWEWSFGVDGISLFFLVLTTFLIPLCFIMSWSTLRYALREYMFCFLALEFLLLVVFSILDVLGFYLFFESTLIPMFLLIGLWGSRHRKIRAAYFLFFYTFLGSLLFLLALFSLWSLTGTTHYLGLHPQDFTAYQQMWYWLAFFLSFAVKIPMLPFHIWLPEAHVEAPTTGSVLLAGILLKLGSYGFLRFSLMLFPWASRYFAPLIYLLGVWSILYASFTAVRQSDMKRIIAYASVAHMNLLVLGLFSFTSLGLTGSVLQMLSHGFVSSGLFFCIGVLYDRYHTRLVFHYSGLSQVMPIFASFFFVYTLANMGLPGTSSFVGEFCIFAGVFQTNVWAGLWSSWGILLSAIYALWLYNRLMFGNLQTQYLQPTWDVQGHESWILFCLLLGVFGLGFYPQGCLPYMEVSLSHLLGQTLLWG